MLLPVARHVNPTNSISGPFLVLPVETAVLVDIQSNTSYFKFHLDYMSLYNLIRLQGSQDLLVAHTLSETHRHPGGTRAAASAAPAALFKQGYRRSESRAGPGGGILPESPYRNKFYRFSPNSRQTRVSF
jgi:hypothetical protein